jgi:hypothetical protein
MGKMGLVDEEWLGERDGGVDKAEWTELNVSGSFWW